MIKELFSYLKNPVDCPIRKPKISDFISLYFITLLLSIPFGVLTLVVTKTFHLEDLVNKEFEHLSLKFVISLVLISPIAEEILLRSWLRFSKRNLLLLVTTLSLLIIDYAYKSRISGLIILSFILFLILFFVYKFSRKSIEKFIDSKFSYFFYAETFLFGLGHAFNFAGNISVLLLFSFILGGRQLIAGLTLGFIRMNYGLIYSIIFHIVINSIALLLMIKK